MHLGWCKRVCLRSGSFVVRFCLNGLRECFGYCCFGGLGYIVTSRDRGFGVVCFVFACCCGLGVTLLVGVYFFRICLGESACFGY